MNFAQFQATGRDVADLRAVESIAAQLADDSTGPLPARIYGDGLFIETGVEDNAPVYHLAIGSDSRVSFDLPRLERALYDFAVSEGYIDGEQS